MKKLEILIEEYRISVDAHKQSFEEALSVIKFYTSTVLVVLGVVLIKGAETTLPEYVLKYVFIILFLLTVLAIAVHVQIVKRRTRNIRRINFLRSKIFRLKFTPSEIESYDEITRFNVNKRVFATAGTLGPIIFYLATLVLFIVIMIKS